MVESGYLGTDRQPKDVSIVAVLERVHLAGACTKMTALVERLAFAALFRSGTWRLMAGGRGNRQALYSRGKDDKNSKGQFVVQSASWLQNSTWPTIAPLGPAKTAVSQGGESEHWSPSPPARQLQQGMHVSAATWSPRGLSNVSSACSLVEGADEQPTCSTKGIFCDVHGEPTHKNAR